MISLQVFRPTQVCEFSLLQPLSVSSQIATCQPYQLQRLPPDPDELLLELEELLLDELDELLLELEELLLEVLLVDDELLDDELEFDELLLEELLLEELLLEELLLDELPAPHCSTYTHEASLPGTELVYQLAW